MDFTGKSITPWELLSKAIPNSTVSDFNFSMPLIVKSASDGDGKRYIEGVASTPDKDLQGEFVIQKGMDLRYFLQHGYFNNDHKPGFKNKVGQPTKAVIKNIKDLKGNACLGLWVEGYLWPKGAHDVADDIWELAKALAVSGSKRRLGFSIQGKVLERDNKKLLKAWIQDIAITPSPVNTRTWMEVVEDFGKSWASVEDFNEVNKSLGAGLNPTDLDYLDNKALSVAGGSPLVPESLEGTRNATFNRSKKDEDNEVEKSLDFAYREMVRRGYHPEMAHKAAVAAVARTLLSPNF